MGHRYMKRLLLVLLGLFVLTLIAIGVVDLELRTPVSPMGIISFEFCGFTSTCEEILSQWGTEGQKLAMFSLGIDYLYMVLYPSVICVGLLLVAAKVPARINNITRGLAWVALCAGVADAFENYFLIRILLSGTGETSGFLAGAFATTKFFVFGVTVSWLLFTVLVYGLRRKNA